MRVDTVFVEKTLKDSPRVQGILNRLIFRQVQWIDNFETYWFGLRKPFRERYRPRNLFLASCKQNPIKPAPLAYGYPTRARHYFYSLGLNCPFKCQYCFLQSEFHNDDFVFFVNWEILQEAILKLTVQHRHDEVWFHDGQYWDSLALAAVTDHTLSWRQFWETLPENAFWEWRTKSANPKALREVTPHSRWILSWSLMPPRLAQIWDLGAAPVLSRMRLARALHERGFPVAFHFDPIIITPDWRQLWDEFLGFFMNQWKPHEVFYMSLGVIRWPSSKRHFPQARHFWDNRPVVKTSDGYDRDPAWVRLPVLEWISQKLRDWGLPPERLVWSMENDAYPKE